MCRWWLLIIIGVLFVSCKKGPLSQRNNAAPAAEHYMRCLAEGRLEEYLKGMSSMDDASVDYRRYTQVLLKQFLYDTVKKYGKVASVVCERTEVDDQSAYANAFLRLTYENDSSEVVLLPLIWQDGQWRLR